MPSPSRAAPSGAQPTLSPMPTTTYAGPAVRPPGRARRPACGRRAADRSATSASATRRRPRGTPAAAASATRCVSSCGCVGHVAEQDRHQQVRARRRVPAAVEAAAAGGLVSATSTLRSGAPAAAAASRSAFVLPVSSTMVICHVALGSGHRRNIGTRAHQDPDRQPWRDRRPRHPRRPRARHHDGRGVQRARSQRAPRPPRRRGLRARRADRGRELPQHRGDPRGHRRQRRRRGASRLRVLQRERRLRPGDHRQGRHVHRPAAGGDRRDGRQGQLAQGRAARWRTDRARHHRVRRVGRRDPRVRRTSTASRWRSRPRSAAAAAA